MTFFWGDRHFDQVKRVEKSPNAKQYYRLLSTHHILSFRAQRSMSFRGHIMPEETPGKGLSPGKDTDLWWSLRCKWSFPAESEVCLWQVKFHQRWSCGEKSIYFFVYPCSYHKLGDLSTSLEMTVLFLVVISTSPDHAVISTKWNAWRNPLMRSSTFPRLSFRGFEKTRRISWKGYPLRRSSATPRQSPPRRHFDQA